MKILTVLFCLTMIFTGKTFAQMPPLETGVSQVLAKWRSANYSDVRYKLNITLEKGAPLMTGDIEIRVNLTDEGAKNDLVLDWRTTQFQNDKDKPSAEVVKVNEQFVKDTVPNGVFDYHILKEHILVSKKYLKTGENTLLIKFASPIKTSGAAITRYVDKEDGAEYIYSLFVPSDASTAFPVFDQPDLKARFQLNVNAPYGWEVISNTELPLFKVYDGQLGRGTVPQSIVTSFPETKPISTYVFAFAAGEFAEFVENGETGGSLRVSKGGNDAPSNDSALTDVRASASMPNPKTEMSEPPAVAGGLQDGINSSAKQTANPQTNYPPATAGGSDLLTKIYVRKSQAEKFKPHADEVFRLNREGVKCLEEYFDYKFPFPKYDLVLIPEFPFGGMEHAGATFLRETSVIFPTEPTKNDYVSRANVIFHEAAHQWFGDTVTMKWFDDLWLKEGFAEFMAYKTLEKVMPEYNAWKIFYERNKQAAYLTDVTRGTTPIYQEIPNLSSAKSAYGNIVYRKAPSFLKQAEFFWGAENFQKAVRNFLKNHEFANATWRDLVKEIEEVSVAQTKNGEHYQKLSDRDKTELEKFERWSVNTEWAEFWVNRRGTAIYRTSPKILDSNFKLEWALGSAALGGHTIFYEAFLQSGTLKEENYNSLQDVKVLKVYDNEEREIGTAHIGSRKYASLPDEQSKPREEYKFTPETEEDKKIFEEEKKKRESRKPLYVFPNYQDYGYGIFLLDAKSRDYVLQNIQTEKDDFLRAMMWGSLWDSVREGELAPAEYVTLVIKNLDVETDESTIQTLLGRTATALNYYIDLGFGNADFGLKENQTANPKSQIPNPKSDGSDLLRRRLEDLLIEKMQNAQTAGQKITFYRAFLNTASSEKARNVLKEMLKQSVGSPTVKEGLTVNSAKTEKPALTLGLPTLRTKDKFDIVTRLLILGDADAPVLLAELEKTETSDEAKRYAYAAKAGIATAENKAKFWNDFVNNKEISESWVEAAFVTFNASKHADLTLPYLEKALAELPNLKRNRKIFFVNGWLAAFIGGQKSEAALKIINDFLAKNPNLDKDLRLKILENADAPERAVKIRAKFGK